MGKETVGRNDPCPCGSGKKYKRCCMSKNYGGPGREKMIHSRLLHEVLDFCKRYYRESLDEADEMFWGDFNPEEDLPDNLLEMADINFWEWVVYDWCPDGKRNMVELYMEKVEQFTPDETKILRIMKESVLSLYEVQEIFPEKGLLLKDLLLGGEYDVKEKLATAGLRKWGIFATRLLRLDDVYVMSGCIYVYPRRTKENLINSIQKGFKKHKKLTKRDSMRDYLKGVSEVFNFILCDLILHPQEIVLSTTTGEQFVLSKGIFEVIDIKAAEKGLNSIKDFRREEKGEYVWLDDRKKDQSTVLGTIRLEGKVLTLECFSKERLTRGKKLITGNLGEAVSYRADTYEDVSEASSRIKGKDLDDTGDDVFVEIPQDVYNAEMKKYYEKWLDMSIPALDDKTPRQALKTKKGKEQLKELLRYFEYKEDDRRKRGKSYFKVKWLWDKLGLEPEE
ncbi:hypothetical protein GF359_01275 [candidate division WOR-3 bacterium]|uniref:SEC-C domain-containing protein n=1 Tax=candidate division WOR-3 bacterium TaxID=2052148 RepID=A0A9D5K7N6_UNCW3|nr:hypothetical protein [candidate division WOR-3 bacterium]MBD3363826.1 hypothetical protein [candidate division WOR-3 bacterium]